MWPRCCLIGFSETFSRRQATGFLILIYGSQRQQQIPEIPTRPGGPGGRVWERPKGVSQQFLTEGLFLRAPRRSEWIAKGALLKPRTNKPRDWCSYSKYGTEK